MFNKIESAKLDDNDKPDEILVGRDSYGDYVLVFDGPGGLEATINFTGVCIQNRVIELTYASYMDGRDEAVVATLEGSPAEYGDVGAFLSALEEAIEAQ